MCVCVLVQVSHATIILPSAACGGDDVDHEGGEEVRSEGGEDGDDGEGEEAVVGGEENHEDGVGGAVDLIKQVPRI